MSGLVHYMVAEAHLPAFEAQARGLVALRHTHVPRVLRWGKEDGQLFVLAETATGDALSTLIENGDLPIDMQRAAIEQMLDAMQTAHAAGLVHGRLAPERVRAERLPGAGVFVSIEGFLDRFTEHNALDVTVEDDVRAIARLIRHLLTGEAEPARDGIHLVPPAVLQALAQHIESPTTIKALRLGWREAWHTPGATSQAIATLDATLVSILESMDSADAEPAAAEPVEASAAHASLPPPPPEEPAETSAEVTWEPPPPLVWGRQFVFVLCGLAAAAVLLALGVGDPKPLTFDAPPAPTGLAPVQAAQPVSLPPAPVGRLAPATVAPATVAPATVAPATAAPATVAPATAAPQSIAPETAAPATAAPTPVQPVRRSRRRRRARPRPAVKPKRSILDDDITEDE